MTNVPQKIRDAWADIYKLFDVSYSMDGSDKAWEQYWNKATELIKKYGDDVPMVDILTSVAHMLEFFVEQRKPKNESLPWKADEDYPYPK